MPTPGETQLQAGWQGSLANVTCRGQAESEQAGGGQGVPGRAGLHLLTLDTACPRPAAVQPSSQLSDHRGHRPRETCMSLPHPARACMGITRLNKTLGRAPPCGLFLGSLSYISQWIGMTEFYHHL